MGQGLSLLPTRIVIQDTSSSKGETIFVDESLARQLNALKEVERLQQEINHLQSEVRSMKSQIDAHDWKIEMIKK